jgi:hypothetical protein
MDIFWGEGWTTWSRVRLITEPKNDFLHMDGIRLPWNVRIALSRYLRINLK